MSNYNRYGDPDYQYDYLYDYRERPQDFTVSYRLGPNGIEEEIKGPRRVTTEEALRILRNYDRLLYENQSTGRLEPLPAIPAQPTLKKEPPKPQVVVLLTRADQLQMELDQADKIEERKEMADNQRFASLELD